MKTKEQKREEAQARQETYNQLTLKERQIKLDEKLGFNCGAKKERARLDKMMEQD